MHGLLRVYREGSGDSIGDFCWETAFVIKTYSNSFQVTINIAQKQTNEPP